MAESRKSNWRERRVGKMRIPSLLLVGALALGASPTADAAIIVISTLSSDATDPGVLDATFEFSVLFDVLTLSVTNDTTAPNTFNINELYFNAAGGVTGLTVLGALPAGWSFSTNQIAGVFGTFEFALTDPVDNDASTIMPLETETFTFTILGVGPFFDTDFTTEFSTNPPGDLLSPVAAKFVFGSRTDPAGDPGPDSAYGGVPEPGTIALLGLAGLLGFGRRRRRLS